MVTKTSRSDRIDIWRKEVASSQIYCVCSAPALRAQAYGTSDRSGLSGRIPSMTAPATPVAPTDSKNQGNPSFTLAPGGDQRKRPRPKFLSLGSSLDLSERFRPSDGSDCSICASPNDGVEYKSISTDGSGLVWRMNDASRSISNSLKRLEQGGTAKPNRPLLDRISKAFRHTKKSSESLKVDNLPGGSKATTAGWSDKIPGRTTGTEMYYLLRRERIYEGTIDKESGDGILGGPSEDSDKKPGIGIGESAARLERARRMLADNTR